MLMGHVSCRVHRQLSPGCPDSSADRFCGALGWGCHDTAGTASPMAGAEVCGAAEPIHPGGRNVSEPPSHRCAVCSASVSQRLPLLERCSCVTCGIVRTAGSLDWQAYARFGGWLLISILVYVVYGMHAADAYDRRQADMCVLRSPSPKELHGMTLV